MKSLKRHVCRTRGDSNRRLPAVPCAVLAALVALTNISVSAAQPSPVVLGLEVVSRLLFAPREPVRLILGGEVTEVLEVARQQGLTIHRTLDHYVVVSASAAAAAQQMLWGDQQSDGQQMIWGDSLAGGDPWR